MITEAMQGAAPVAAGAVAGWLLFRRWMQSDATLPGGYEAATGEWDRWGQALRKPAARKGAR